MPITRINKKNIENMTDVRQAEIISLSPELKQEDFASEAEYREALLKNYQALRQKEYELTVQNECMKVYNLAKDGRAVGINENSGVWNGYERYTQSRRVSSAERQRRKQQVEDCAISRAPKMSAICMYDDPHTLSPANNSCAITAAAITAQVSAKMGYDGENNLMQAKYRGKTPYLQNNLVAAQGVANCDSIPDQYKKKIEPITKINAKTKKEIPHTPTLKELIAEGTIGIGDAFAVKTGARSNTSTGYHALTLAAVEKDENGKITGYTLQANNGCRFSSHKMNELNYFSNKPVYNVTNTHAWVGDKIKTETQTLENLPTADLEAKLAAQKQKTLALTENLKKTESYAATKNYCIDMAQCYVTNVNKKFPLITQTELPTEENHPPIPTNDNTSDKETLKQDLKHQTATPSPAEKNQAAQFKSDQFDARVDLHNNKKQLPPQDVKQTTSHKSAMFEERVNAAIQSSVQSATPPHTDTNTTTTKQKNTPQTENPPHKNAPEVSINQLITLKKQQGR
ncbi:MAG: hypothetical protein J6J35_05010 [Alphaproteobacteria bacterium]|nr:hypothetical protein [Alphaproteobacteria bacterium]